MMRAPEPGVSLDGMIGESPRMRDVFARILRVAALDRPVAVHGETGTGKELVARAIHRRSMRASGPFVPVNCSAIPTTLFEAEVFGHERGAFTDAKDAKPGSFELANHGTLFLDEIADLPLEAQPKLLRVIEEKVVTRLGGHRPIAVDVRIVSATSIDLREAVGRKAFRDDLYWRLGGSWIRLPPLRERAGDIHLLIDHLLPKLRRECQASATRIAAEARCRLSQHLWPGNVRELEQALVHGLLSADGDAIRLADLPDSISLNDARAPAILARPAELTLPMALKLVIEDLERELIRQALNRHATLAEAALDLGIDLKTLYEKRRRYQLSHSTTPSTQGMRQPGR